MHQHTYIFNQKKLPTLNRKSSIHTHTVYHSSSLLLCVCHAQWEFATLVWATNLARKNFFFINITHTRLFMHTDSGTLTDIWECAKYAILYTVMVFIHVNELTQLPNSLFFSSFTAFCKYASYFNYHLCSKMAGVWCLFSCILWLPDLMAGNF